MHIRSVCFLLATVFMAAASVALAQGMPADAPGARDYAVLSRYAGSWLVAQEVKTFDRASVPAGDTDVVAVDGRVTRLFYQLDEMARVLQSNAVVKVFIVGHTDNQGALDANLALSKARAQAVVDALTNGYKVDGKRLSASGVANYAALASNASENGRARNRRVEMVLQ